MPILYVDVCVGFFCVSLYCTLLTRAIISLFRFVRLLTPPLINTHVSTYYTPPGICTVSLIYGMRRSLETRAYAGDTVDSYGTNMGRMYGSVYVRAVSPPAPLHAHGPRATGHAHPAPLHRHRCTLLPLTSHLCPSLPDLCGAPLLAARHS